MNVKTSFLHHDPILCYDFPRVLQLPVSVKYTSVNFQILKTYRRSLLYGNVKRYILRFIPKNSLCILFFRRLRLLVLRVKFANKYFHSSEMQEKPSFPKTLLSMQKYVFLGIRSSHES